MKRKYKYDSTKRAHCGHRFCTKCLTKRGRKFGIRNMRRKAKEEIRNER